MIEQGKREMRICAQNPIQPEFSLCGDAFDIAQTEDDAEDFKFAAARGERVTCYNCRRTIAFIYEIYTPNGRVRKTRCRNGINC